METRFLGTGAALDFCISSGGLFTSSPVVRLMGSIFFSILGDGIVASLGIN